MARNVPHLVLPAAKSVRRATNQNIPKTDISMKLVKVLFLGLAALVFASCASKPSQQASVPASSGPVVVPAK